MAEQTLSKQVTIRELFSFFGIILSPESGFFYLAIIYGVGISLLSLAIPVSVQMLINTVANTGLTTPLIVLAVVLFILLLLSGLLRALRVYIMELFQRRFYARMVSEIALRSLFALNPFFQDYRMGALFNRYFDIVIVQKAIPDLVIGAFTIVLHAAVGFVLVSLYHPLFLAYNLVLIAFIWLIWQIWGPRAIRSAVEMSHKKHATAAWLESLGMSNGFFKSEWHIAEALKRTDQVTGDYIDKHAKHFRNHFAQTISFLLLFAAASAMLLGLGGWLVIEGELTLGQLVAAELVLSVALFGVSQLGVYLTYFYELAAAIDELSLFYDVDQEPPGGHIEHFGDDSRLEFVEARGDARGMTTTINVSIPAKARVMGVAETHGVQRELTNFIKLHVRPVGGYVALGGVDITEFGVHALRQQIIVLDRPNVMEMTIREYLRLSAKDASATRLHEILRTVGLDEAVCMLDEGLDTRVALTGWPLSITETMQLKLASAIIAKPRVLVLNQLFDVMSDESLRNSLDLLQQNTDCTVIYFTGRRRIIGFDTYLYLGKSEQQLYDSFEELCRQTGNKVCNDGVDPSDIGPVHESG
jgi:putative ABC transport system ATP-binding protein